eukprot:2304997-Rhodomonas_salina.8
MISYNDQVSFTIACDPKVLSLSLSLARSLARSPQPPLSLPRSLSSSPQVPPLNPCYSSLLPALPCFTANQFPKAYNPGPNCTGRVASGI